jgi:type VI secretion system protein ImpA
MTALPVDDLMAPLTGGEPCGPDLEYDADFMALEAAARGTPERQAGHDILPAEPPLWPEVLSRAQALAGRTRDLRLAVLLARAGAHTGGIQAYAQGLALVAGLLEQFWETVHPKLDASDGNDPTMRLNALAPLADAAAGLADLRASLIGKPGSGLTARLVELAWTRAEPVAGEAKPTQAGVLDGLRAAAAADHDLAAAMRSVHAAVARIEQTVSQHAGTAGPDLRPLRRIAEGLAQAATQLDGGAAVAVAEAGDGTGPAAAAAVSAGEIHSREDVLRVLDRVCDWIERQEPTNPAPLLIRRAQRLMSKSFIDLVRDLAPDGLSQIERIAGAADS